MRDRHRSHRPHSANISEDVNDLESEMLAPEGPSLPSPVVRPPVRPAFIQDRRQWAPDDSPREVTGRPARIIRKVTTPKAPKRAGRNSLSASDVRRVGYREGLQFSAPRNVMICIRRKIRRSVLFGLGRTNSKSKKRFNDYSNIRCR